MAIAHTNYNWNNCDCDCDCDPMLSVSRSHTHTHVHTHIYNNGNLSLNYKIAEREFVFLLDTNRLSYFHALSQVCFVVCLYVLAKWRQHQGPQKFKSKFGLFEEGVVFIVTHLF